MPLMEAGPQRFERIDLHMHSHHSDGVLSPTELVTLAAARQVGLLALTDHDTLAGCAEAAQACARHGIEFLPGSELTASWRGRELHVIGLRLAADTPELVAQLNGVRSQRIERVRAIGQRLERCGLPGTEIADAVLAQPGTPTRLHLARELVERGHAADIDDAFDRWLGRGKRAAVPMEWPGIEAACSAIRAAGGVAVLAHPHRYQLGTGTAGELCAQFRDAGGQGIEVSLPGLSPTDASRAASLARRYGLAGSWGSDFHFPGQPWRPLGRFAKLPEGVVPITDWLGPATHASMAP